jgi:O-succinylbenzoate synthase
LELRRARLPLVEPFRTAHGEEHARDVLLVRVAGPDGEGWGECAALPEPTYSPEYVDGAHDVIARHLGPRLLAGRDPAEVRGHPMARAALELAVLDAELRAEGRSFATHLGAVRDRVPAGVAVGIVDDVGALLDAVERRLAEGYRRVKLKVQPGWDLEPVRAVRDRFGDIALHVDANGSYTRADVEHLARLDELDLLMIEQPLPEDDLLGHALVASKLTTPVCLDESITSAAAAETAIELGACSIVNVKAGRVGGYLEARRVHDTCAAHGVPVWCGGMLETGIGRAANVALAALPNFTLAGDLSASERWFATDLTEPFVLENGHLRVPTGPGLGVTIRHDVLDAVTTSVTRL